MNSLPTLFSQGSNLILKLSPLLTFLFLFFHNLLYFSPSPRLSQSREEPGQPSQSRLPSSTVVTTLPSNNLPASTIVTNLDEPLDKPAVAAKEEEASVEAGELKLPPGLKLTMAPAGMVKLAAGPPDPPAQVLQLDVGPSLVAAPSTLLPQVRMLLKFA